MLQNADAGDRIKTPQGPSVGPNDIYVEYGPMAVYHSLGPVILDVVNRGDDVTAVSEQVREGGRSSSNVQDGFGMVIRERFQRESKLHGSLIGLKDLSITLGLADSPNVPAAHPMGCALYRVHLIQFSLTAVPMLFVQPRRQNHLHPGSLRAIRIARRLLLELQAFFDIGCGVQPLAVSSQGALPGG